MALKSKVLEVNWVGKWTYNCLNRDCPVCRSSMDTTLDKKNNVILGECGHGFHNKCLTEWFKQIGHIDKKCPVCFKKWKENNNTKKSNKGFSFFPELNIDNYSNEYFNMMSDDDLTNN